MKTPEICPDCTMRQSLEDGAVEVHESWCRLIGRLKSGDYCRRCLNKRWVRVGPFGDDDEICPECCCWRCGRLRTTCECIRMVC